MIRSWFPITAALLCLTLVVGTSALAQQPDPFGGSPDLAPADAPADDATDDQDAEEDTAGEIQTIPVQSQPLPPLESLPSGNQRSPLGSTAHQAHLDENGNLRGRLNLIDPQTNSLVPAQDLQVYLIQNGRVIERVTPGPGGQFVLESVSPGVYSVVAQGPAGFTAFSIQVLPYDPTSPPDTPTELALNGTIIPVGDLAVLPPMPGALPPPFPPGAPGGFGGGGFMGGGGSGGGGLGDFGGLGTIAGLAGLALGLSQLDDDDEDGIVRPRDISP